MAKICRLDCTHEPHEHCEGCGQILNYYESENLCCTCENSEEEE